MNRSELSCSSLYVRALNSPDLGRFYKRNGYKGKIQPDDLCVWLEQNGKIIAAARLTMLKSEAKPYIQLRGVWVDKQQRGKGLGSLLLTHIKQHPEKGSIDLYCLAFTHLETFYQKHGFKKLSNQECPTYLSLAEVRYKKRGTPTILMQCV